MGSAWGPDIYDMAAWTSSQEEEVDMIAWEKDSEEQQIEMVE